RSPLGPAQWPWLLRFLVQLMRVAARAILLPLNALRVQALVLGGEVIAVFALAAREDDLVAGHGRSSDLLSKFELSVVTGRQRAWLTPSAGCLHHLRIFVTTPAPTVRPPSRIAKRRPSSIATGVIRSIVI